MRTPRPQPLLAWLLAALFAATPLTAKTIELVLDASGA